MLKCNRKDVLRHKYTYTRAKANTDMIIPVSSPIIAIFFISKYMSINER